MIIQFIIIFILIISYFWVFVKKSYKYQKDPIHDYRDIRNKLKTGDIILFHAKKMKKSVMQLNIISEQNLLARNMGMSVS